MTRSHRGMHQRLTYRWWMNLILAALMRLVSLWKGWRPPMLNILLMEITEKEWKTLRPQVEKERHRITFLYGFFSGCSIALIVSIIVNIHARDLLRSQGRHQYVVNIFLLYSLFVYIGLHMLMYSGNIFSWKRYRVNFSFIFGFKQRTELGYREVLLSTALSLLALAGAISHLDMEIDPRTKSFTVLTELIPLVLLLAVLSIMFCPFNIIYRSSRFFLIKCTFYSVCAPLDKVTLLDFFLADQLTSQVLKCLLRLAWMQQVLGIQSVPFVHNTVLIAVIASLEIICRGIWNFLSFSHYTVGNATKREGTKGIQWSKETLANVHHSLQEKRIQIKEERTRGEMDGVSNHNNIELECADGLVITDMTISPKESNDLSSRQVTGLVGPKEMVAKEGDGVANVGTGCVKIEPNQVEVRKGLPPLDTGKRTIMKSKEGNRESDCRVDISTDGESFSKGSSCVRQPKSRIGRDNDEHQAITDMESSTGEFVSTDSQLRIEEIVEKDGKAQKRRNSMRDTINEVSLRENNEVRHESSTLEWCMPSSLLDHNPVLLGVNDVDWGSKPFRFFNRMEYVVGNGANISFWDDEWIEGITLRIAFLWFFALAINKSGKVCELGSWVKSVWQWEVNLRRRIFDWETNSWKLFKDCLNSIVFDQEMNDKLIWKFTPSGSYTPNSFCRLALHKNEAPIDLWQSVRAGLAPPKVEATSSLLVLNLGKFGAQGLKRGELKDACQGNQLTFTRVAWWAKSRWPNEIHTITDIARSPLNYLATDRRKTLKISAKWECPPAGWFKFNTDRNARGCPSYLGIGGILRDDTRAVKAV
ncbi:Uncharacterized protein TCM_018647 [Theobroma cacao]|uniref:EXS domain-containing protein n=1 Tax=Theobroma cacao TaxID=3641 RepID=A0A061EMI4_THECC|nr:Uncharacterized protein TCM_018647 [Theobroma cacao]